jgi:hypothetical protein
MRLGILQPGYLPWLGFFEQVYRSDTFVIYDDVQYDKHGWRNRNRIKTPTGAQWLTVPVLVKFEEHPLIDEIKIDSTKDWRKKHLFSIKQNYSKAPFYRNYVDMFEGAYSQEWEYLVDIDMYFILKLCECLKINNKKIVRSSTLNIKGDRIGKVIKICKKFNADIFYEGAAGKNYIDEQQFSDNEIKVEYQNYRHPIYKQLYGDFIPYLSVIDLLFNHGPKSLKILTERYFMGVKK